MKKIITLSVLVVVMLGLFTICASANDGTSEPALSASTVYEDILEWYGIYKEEISSLVNLATAGIVMTLFGKARTGITDVVCKTGLLSNAAAGTNQTMGKLIECNNEQVDEIKALRLENAELQKLVKQNTKALAVVAEAVCRVAHIPATVYTNSKALPQGVKNMVNLESAETIKLLSVIEEILGDKVNENIEES